MRHLFEALGLVLGVTILAVLVACTAAWVRRRGYSDGRHLVLVRESKDLRARLEGIQRGLCRMDPIAPSSPETASCLFCHVDRTHSYVTGSRTAHTPDCEWRIACEAQGVPWDHLS